MKSKVWIAAGRRKWWEIEGADDPLLLVVSVSVTKADHEPQSPICCFLQFDYLLMITIQAAAVPSSSTTNVRDAMEIQNPAATFPIFLESSEFLLTPHPYPESIVSH